MFESVKGCLRADVREDLRGAAELFERTFETAGFVENLYTRCFYNMFELVTEYLSFNSFVSQYPLCYTAAPGTDAD